MDQTSDVSASSIWLVLFFCFALILIPFVFYLITLQKTLKAISIENRKMPPSNVWLLFIPLFGIVWHFNIVAKIADSIKAESLFRDVQFKEERPGYSIGMAMCILNCFSIFPNLLGAIGMISGFAFLICWLVYWFKIASYKNQIINSNIIEFDAEQTGP